MIFVVSVKLFVALASLRFLTFIFTLLLTSFPPISFTFLLLPVNFFMQWRKFIKIYGKFFVIIYNFCDIISLFGCLGVVVIPRQGGIVASIPYEIHSTA